MAEGFPHSFAKKSARVHACPRMLTFVLIFSMFFLCQCAGGVEKFAETMGGVFRGNTRKEFTDYNLEDKSEYRRYKLYKKALAEEKEKEILRHMKTSAAPDSR